MSVREKHCTRKYTSKKKKKREKKKHRVDPTVVFEFITLEFNGACIHEVGRKEEKQISVCASLVFRTGDSKKLWLADFCQHGVTH